MSGPPQSKPHAPPSSSPSLTSPNAPPFPLCCSMFEVNFFATLSTTKAALPLLKTYVAQHQHKTQARVVFVSSYVALFPVPMM